MKALNPGRPARADSACRHLAVRVIYQAFRDLSSSKGSRADQESARTFLSGSPMLDRWCEVGHLSAAAMVARATKLMGRPGRLAVRSVMRDDAPASKARIRQRRRDGSHAAADLRRLK